MLQSRLAWLLLACIMTLSLLCVRGLNSNSNSTTGTWEAGNLQRRLFPADCGAYGESSSRLSSYSRYFEGMDAIYRRYSGGRETCFPVHKACGWPSTRSQKPHLPLFVLSVGLEGAGHHLWSEKLDVPVVDCLWINGRHYHRDIGDGVPRTTAAELESGLMEQFKLRQESGNPPCRTIFDAEDSFPTGAIRKSGRLFMRPDIINLQKLDGRVINVKYLIILRNVTDTALSALRRNFFTNVDAELRTVEHTLTYLEAALRSAPCHKTFIAHYEHALADPAAFLNPLASFLELGATETVALKKRLTSSSSSSSGGGGGGTKVGRLPSRKEHKLGQYAECKAVSSMSDRDCYNHVRKVFQIGTIDAMDGNTEAHHLSPPLHL